MMVLLNLEQMLMLLLLLLMVVVEVHRGGERRRDFAVTVAVVVIDQTDCRLDVLVVTMLQIPRFLNDGLDSKRGRSSRNIPVIPSGSRLIVLLVLSVLDLGNNNNKIRLQLLHLLLRVSYKLNKYFVEVVNGSRIASAGHAIFSHSGQHHALTETLLKAAVLASIALCFRDLAVTFSHASVNSLVLYRPFKETFAPVGFKNQINFKI